MSFKNKLPYDGPPGFPYKEYLKSDEWIIKSVRFQVKLGKTCFLCRRISRLIDVHHITYKNIPNERLEDVAILCRSCHKMVHERGLHIKPRSLSDLE